MGNNRPPLSQRTKRLLVGIAIALVVSLAATGAILAASQHGTSTNPLTTKQQKIAQIETQEAQAQLTPVAPKGPPVPIPAICPETYTTHVTYNLVMPTMNAPGAQFTQLHLLMGGGTRYGLYNYTFASGWNLNNPQQGGIIVTRYYYDACTAQAMLPQNANYSLGYLTPYYKGGILMTAIQGPNILFTTQDGASGSFNFVTGQFS